jgi:glycosyltransferase involved in cell wall biosynthesis
VPEQCEIPLTVVIPTYRRGAVVLETIRKLQQQQSPVRELLVVDQTDRHPADIEAELQSMHAAGKIVWCRLREASIPGAMNHGLLKGRGRAVLFLDDDIEPDCALTRHHADAQQVAKLVAGQVLQPGQGSIALAPGEVFRFNSPEPASIVEFMGGNFSVDREAAIALGGFDENFVGAAYRFEAEFAHRFTARHGLIRYEPRALIHHLAVSSGGTRAHGHHLRTLQPAHSVGAYYFLLRTRIRGWQRELLRRPLRAVRTKHHLRHPWWVPLTLIAEARGFLLAVRLFRSGPRLIAARHFAGTNS